MQTITKHEVVVRRLTKGTHREEYVVRHHARLILVYRLDTSDVLTVSPSVHLVGEGAEAVVIGLVSGNKNAKLEMHTMQHHNAPKTTSDLLVKSVMHENSSFSYTGSIRVDKVAQRTDAYQRNENLLMDEQTKATSSPVLEILANDVRCTHGAVIKTIDEQELWYLKSRGIDSSAGRAMIAEGFLTSALSRVADKDERRAVEKQI